MANEEGKLAEFLKAQEGAFGAPVSQETITKAQRRVTAAREKQAALGDIDFAALKLSLGQRMATLESQLQEELSQLNAQERAAFLSSLSNAASMMAMALIPKMKDLFKTPKTKPGLPPSLSLGPPGTGFGTFPQR